MTQTMTPTCKACHASLDKTLTRGHKNGYDLLPCAACGTVTVAPFPTTDELMHFYQSYKGSAVYKPKQASKIRRATRRIRRLTDYTPGRKFLDVGCNQGFAVKAALDLQLDAQGIDIDAAAIESAGQSFGQQHFTASSVEQHMRAGNKADIIYTSEVIEHVPDPDSFAQALAGILNPGGVVYLTTPDGGHWRVPKDFASWRMVTPPSHIVYFTRAGIRSLFARHGLHIEKFFFTLKPGIRLIARRGSSDA
jgi:2-polyprenyl-3-methyl-5-hydroxy-6-metoxy-1,4-benzoquinol methylase